MEDRHYALAREAILAALTAYTGITTADGATPAKNTLICADLIDKNDFITGKTILIGSGDAKFEDSGASLFVPGTGTITVASAFSAQIKKGTIFRVLNISTVEIDVDRIDTKIGTNTDAAGTTTVFARLRQIVDTYLASGTSGLAALKTLIDAVEAKLDKLAGETPVSGTANKTWNTGEADVVSLGADNTKYKLHSLVLSIHNLVGTTITVRMYMQVKGTERRVYEQAFDATTDPPGLWIVNGTIGIHEVLRVTLQSNNAADDNKDVDYDYLLEVM